MLQALAEAGVTPDVVVGASVGAINGAHFAAAPNAAGVTRLATIWRGIRRADVFPVSVARSVRALVAGNGSLVSSTGLRRLLEANLPCSALEETAIPVHVVATDFASGEEVVLSRGSAVDAVMASAAIPAVFPPVALAGRQLVDGGIASNTPVTNAVTLGATRLVVLPTGFTCREEPEPHSAIGMALHALNLLIARQLVGDLQRLPPEIRVRVVPPLCPLARSAYDFSGTEELIERAAKSTRRWLERGGLEDGTLPGELQPHAH